MNLEIFDIPLHKVDGDGTVTCSIYVGEAIEGVHPLEQQDAWYRRERGLAIPQEVMSSFGKLAVLALENKRSFSELCVKAFTDASKELAEAAGEDT